MALALSGTVQARLDPGGKGLSLTREDGQAVLAYRGLTAWDATGRTLPARLQLRGAELRLEIEDAGARYPLVVDPFVEDAKLTTSPLQGGQEFGGSVAVDGDTVVVGARRADLGLGAAYVFVKPAGGWASMTTQTAKLTASDGGKLDLFGFSVSISGDTVVVGAYQHEGTVDHRCAAYIFVKPDGGPWTDMPQTARLTASDGGNSHFFGRSVAISGDTVAVGAPGAGSVYVFVKPAGGWASMTTLSENVKLPASGGGSEDHSVAISGDTLVVGRPFAGLGDAVVYVKPAGGWGTAPATGATLIASDRAAVLGGPDFFGWSVAISGDTVVVGSFQDDVGPGSDHGSA